MFFKKIKIYTRYYIQLFHELIEWNGGEKHNNGDKILQKKKKGRHAMNFGTEAKGEEEDREEEEEERFLCARSPRVEVCVISSLLVLADRRETVWPLISN